MMINAAAVELEAFYASCYVVQSRPTGRSVAEGARVAVVVVAKPAAKPAVNPVNPAVNPAANPAANPVVVQPVVRPKRTNILHWVRL